MPVAKSKMDDALILALQYSMDKVTADAAADLEARARKKKKYI